MNNTTNTNEQSEGELPDSPSSVAEYLRKHREFFVEHPELLTDLMIPHQTGKAVSLVEKQVELLRDENRELKAKFRELVAIARDNEELSRRMHKLTLQLVEATSIDRVLDGLYENLRDDFAADHVVLRIFAEPAEAVGSARDEFVGAGSVLRSVFADALQQRKPVCGRLKRSQQEALFEDESEQFGSAAVLPLIGKHWDGILVIASHDPRRYHPEMGIDLLSHLGDISSLIIQPWVDAAPSG
jgi:hypothetical protein